MTHAINTYRYIRAQQGLNPIDACTDAAQFHGVSVVSLATALIAMGIDAQRLNNI